MVRASLKRSWLIADLLNLMLLSRVKVPYDYVFNLSALKHVRSEKDPLHVNANDHG